MTILAVETALGACSVAVTDGQSVQVFRHDPEHARQAATLLPMIEAALVEAGIAIQDLDALAVAIGPGSFTGVRIGLAALLGMGLAAQVPVIGIGTLEAAGFLIDGPAHAVLDASRGHVYMQTFDAEHRPLSEARMLEVAAAAETLSTDRPLVGNGAALVDAARPHTFGFHVMVPDARHVALAALAALARGEAPPPAPLYIRPPDATIPQPFLKR